MDASRAVLRYRRRTKVEFVPQFVTLIIFKWMAINLCNRKVSAKRSPKNSGEANDKIIIDILDEEIENDVKHESENNFPKYAFFFSFVLSCFVQCVFLGMGLFLFPKKSLF